MAGGRKSPKVPRGKEYIRFVSFLENIGKFFAIKASNSRSYFLSNGTLRKTSLGFRRLPRFSTISCNVLLPHCFGIYEGSREDFLAVRLWETGDADFGCVPEVTGPSTSSTSFMARRNSSVERPSRLAVSLGEEGVVLIR